ncbi:kynurenine formamidase isoform X4 [Hemicordylus capensis]|uniref:kynurenine formamidase isoform X4 n=1 Tax=Hemicordylus capensis TaxID=884348 RepID=UPI0023029424|nr:kynurenine formamidase isoform X4 [Hemicordylus capensis]
MGKWQEMTKEELETQYSPSRWSPRLDKDAVIEAHVQATSEATHSAQMATQTLLNVPYGLSEGEKLDVYLPKDLSETFPLVLYIHGGYWQFLSGVYLLGHSAGAHLAAMVLSTDWKEFGVVPNIKGAFLVSGVYDLEPITHTYVNDVLHMSREVAQWNSPLKCVPELENRRACQVLITVAQHDSPEFCRQSQEYFEALRAAGWSASLLNIADTDHFDVIEKLSQEDYLLTQVILQMILKG